MSEQDYNGFVEIQEPINTVESLTALANSRGFNHIVLVDVGSITEIKALCKKLWDCRTMRPLKSWGVLKPTRDWTILFCFSDEQDALFAKMLIK